jgi:NDP-sugar pyrophosphorylase family protein
LAGGLATRLHPVTETLPKALIPVAGEPFAFHQLRLLARKGLRRAVFLVGYLGERIVEAVGDGRRFGVEVDYVFDGPQLLGTGGAIAAALPRLGDAFFVLYGDSYLECDYLAAEKAFLSSRKPALMTVFLNEGRWDTSNVEFAEGRILRYSKVTRTPRMRHIDYGLGAFRKDVFADVPHDRPTDLATIYEQLAAAGDLAAYEATQRFYEVGSFSGITELEQHLAQAAL